MKIDPKPGSDRQPIRATVRAMERGNPDEAVRRRWPSCPKARAEMAKPPARRLRLPAVRSML